MSLASQTTWELILQACDGVIELCCKRKAPNKTRVELSRVADCEMGLFAARDIKQGEEIAEFRGEAIDRAEAVRRDALGSGTHIVTLLHGFRYLDCKNTPVKSNETGGAASFANSCRGTALRPNALLRLNDAVGKERAWLRASRDIAAGEEILFNYAF